MLTYTTGRNLYGKLTKNNNTVNLSFGDTTIAESLRIINAMTDLVHVEDSDTDTTVASQQAYTIPKTLRKVSDIYVTVGSTIYTPEKVYDPGRWSSVLQMELGESDVPLYQYIRGRQVLFAPAPATTGNTITFVGMSNTIDPSIADYTTGSITTITNGDTTVTGSGTSWNASMVGRYIRIDDSDAANVGDNRWYKIASVTSTTVLELTEDYEGTSIAAGSATYTIGQAYPLPEAYHMAPVYRATALYWDTEGNAERADRFWQLYDGGYEMGRSPYPGGIIGMMIAENSTFDGNYIPPSSVASIDINNYPQDLTGF